MSARIALSGRVGLWMTFPLVFACLIGRVAAADKAEKRTSPPRLHVSMVVDFGQDVGQNFGSLFEIKNQQGVVIAGAGFLGAYNTEPRGNRRRLNFFLKPRFPEAAARTTPLPRVSGDSGVYLFEFNRRLYAMSRSGGKDLRLRYWDARSSRWRVEERPVRDAIDVADGVLTTSRQRIQYNDQIVLDVHRLPEQIGSHYYARGHLIFRFVARQKKPPVNRLVACPWSPDGPKLADLNEARTIDLRSPGEFVYAFGQLGGVVLAATNTGGVYRFDGDRWEVMLEPDLKVSYQVYAMLNYYDRLLLGQYPTGQLFQFDRQRLRRLEGWPPVMPGVSPHARETQTLAIYGGDLYAGVWPWAEVWRYRRDDDKWSFVRRMFSHPKPTDAVNHPYETETKRVDKVYNLWGQRVTSMVPMGDSLYIATSAKTSRPLERKFDFLMGRQNDYGLVYRFTLPNQWAAEVRWKAGPTKFDFELSDGKMTVSQDGDPLGSVALQLDAAEPIEPAQITWGDGVYGRCPAKIDQRSMLPRP